MARNKAVVGTNAFAHESGIHVAAVLEEPRTYELYSPEMVGAARHIIIGKHTGAKALKYITQRMGYYLKDKELGRPLGTGEDVQRVQASHKLRGAAQVDIEHGEYRGYLSGALS